MRRIVITAALLAALAVPAAADRADDDLAAVKKAVGSSAQAQAKPPAEDQAPEATVKPRPRRGEAQWFRVRVVEKGRKGAKVSLNLPLILVRAVGEDWQVQGCRRCEHGHGPTIGDVLRALDSGQSLVEIDDDDATVRVWVD